MFLPSPSGAAGWVAGGREEGSRPVCFVLNDTEGLAECFSSGALVPALI